MNDAEPKSVVMQVSSPERRRHAAAEIRRLRAILDADAARIKRRVYQSAALLAAVLAIGIVWVFSALLTF